jgi:hypothetical protein
MGDSPCAEVHSDIKLMGPAIRKARRAIMRALCPSVDAGRNCVQGGFFCDRLPPMHDALDTLSWECLFLG